MTETTLGETVRTAIAKDVERLLRNEAILHEGGARTDGPDTVEAVHQMRVATRRLRSDLRTFSPVLDRRWARELRRELDGIASMLGAARDADVLAERLSGRAQEVGPERAQRAAEALAALAEQRARAHATLREALAGERHEALLDRLRAAASSPSLRSSEKADRSAGEALPALVRRAWRGLEKEVASLPRAPSDEELHGVRIAAKRCRYAAEACAPTSGKPTARLACACKRLQTTLGELNDAVVAERWLREWAAGASSPAGVKAALELAALERAAARKARTRWRKAWEHALVETPTSD